MTAILEDRFAALEAEVERLRNKLEGQRPNEPGQTSADFLETMVGIHADSPAFEEMTRQIEQEREQEREQARRPLAEDEAGA